MLMKTHLATGQIQKYIYISNHRKKRRKIDTKRIPLNQRIHLTIETQRSHTKGDKKNKNKKIGTRNNKKVTNNNSIEKKNMDSEAESNKT
jgi:hypothetical protein